MLQQIILTISRPDPLLRICIQALFDKLPTLFINRIELIVEFEWAQFYLFVIYHFWQVLVVRSLGHLEWGKAKEHFIKKNANSPPVDLKPVSRLLDHLRCNILLSPADRECCHSPLILILLQEPSHSKVNQLDEAILSYHDILHF